MAANIILQQPADREAAELVSRGGGLWQVAVQELLGLKVKEDVWVQPRLPSDWAVRQ